MHIIQLNDKGFTLVELSIVLVIIGLLIGGVLVGQSLMGSAKINAQIKQLEQYDIATTNFRQKYKQWPGDSTYFAHTGGYTGGNGNGFINDPGDNIPPQSLLDEPNRFFPHLYTSGILNEASQAAYRVGKTGSMPELKIAPKRGMAVTMNRAGNLFYFLGIYEVFGGAMAYFQMSQSGIISPTTAMTLDAKIDDGKPDTGNIRAVTQYPVTDASYLPHVLDYTSNNCRNSSNEYVLTETNNKCRLMVKSNAIK